MLAPRMSDLAPRFATLGHMMKPVKLPQPKTGALTGTRPCSGTGPPPS